MSIAFKPVLAMNTLTRKINLSTRRKNSDENVSIHGERRKEVERMVRLSGNRTRMRGCFTKLERRNHMRIDMVLPIECSFPGNTSSFRLITENISAEGLNFVSTSPIGEGQIVELRILIRNNLPLIVTRGRVTWNRKLIVANRIYYTGTIGFFCLNRLERDALQRFVERHRFVEKAESYTEQQNKWRRLLDQLSTAQGNLRLSFQFGMKKQALNLR